MTRMLISFCHSTLPDSNPKLVASNPSVRKVQLSPAFALRIFAVAAIDCGYFWISIDDITASTSACSCSHIDIDFVFVLHPFEAVLE